MKVRDLWLVALVIGVFAPVILRIFSPERQGFWTEVTTITGLQAVILLVITVILPSRIKSLTRSFGIESVLRNHRTLGLTTAGVTLAHIIAVVINDPRNVGLLLPFINRQQPDAPVIDDWLVAPPARSIAGLVATAAIAALAVWALRRQRQGTPYKSWRIWHLALSALVLVTAVVHILLIGHLAPTGALSGLLRGDPIGWQVLSAAVSADPVSPLFLAALAALLVAVGVRRWLVSPLQGRGRYQVVAVTPMSDSAITISLAPTSKSPTLFEEGQFAWLRLHRSPFAEEHPFTISSAMQDAPQIDFTVRNRGDWTRKLRSVRPGTPVWVDGPHGAFTPEESTTGLVLIAAGIGVTPMMSILRTAARAGRRWRGRHRSFCLILVERPGESLFGEELHELAAELDLAVVHMPPDPGITAGSLATLLPGGRLDEYYLCGPPSMVDDGVRALDELGVPWQQVHTEQFVI